jgi:hypothetical protein
VATPAVAVLIFHNKNTFAQFVQKNFLHTPGVPPPEDTIQDHHFRREQVYIETYHTFANNCEKQERQHDDQRVGDNSTDLQIHYVVLDPREFCGKTIEFKCSEAVHLII